PNEKSPAWLKHTSDIFEPHVKQFVKFVLGQKVIGQRSIFGPQLSIGGACLLGMPGQVERLVVLGSLERTQPGGDGIVRSGFNLYAVWRVAGREVSRRTGRQTVHVRGQGAVRAAQS